MDHSPLAALTISAGAETITFSFTDTGAGIPLESFGFLATGPAGPSSSRLAFFIVSDDANLNQQLVVDSVTGKRISDIFLSLFDNDSNVLATDQFSDAIVAGYQPNAALGGTTFTIDYSKVKDNLTPVQTQVIKVPNTVVPYTRGQVRRTLRWPCWLSLR